MAYTASFSVNVGDPTKANDVATLAANDDFLKTAIDKIMADSATPTFALANGVTATTQSAGNNSTLLSTTAYADAAGVSLSGSTNNTIATVTGANALIGEANLTFDGSKFQIGSGISTPNTNGDDLVLNGSGNVGMSILGNAASSASIIYLGYDSDESSGRIFYQNHASAPYMDFYVNDAHTMRIDSSGNVNIGTTHTGAAKFEVNNNANSGFISGKATHGDVTGNSLQMWFVSSSEADGDVPFQLNAAYGSGGTQVGAIDCTVDDVTGGTIDSHWNHRSYQNSVAKVASLSAAGVWTDASAAAGKEYEGTRQQVWPTGILPSICALNVSKYRPANQPEGKPVGEYHISPTAEDLFDAFGVGEDPHTPKLNKDGENITTPGIAPKDLAGIALVGIQELCELVEAQAARITALEAA